MKNLFVAACMVLGICFSSSPVRAADWSNGTFSCDLNVIEYAEFIDFFNWGKWQKMHVTFFLTEAPASSVTFICSSYTISLTTFTCYIDIHVPADGKRVGWYEDKMSPQYIFNPGTTKAQACEKIFKVEGIRKKR